MWMEYLNLNIFQNYSSHMFLFKNPVCSNWHFTSFLKKSNLLHIIFNDFFPGHKKGTRNKLVIHKQRVSHKHSYSYHIGIWMVHMCIGFNSVLCSLHAYYEAYWIWSKWRTMPKTNNSFYKIRFTVLSLENWQANERNNQRIRHMTNLKHIFICDADFFPSTFSFILNENPFQWVND